MEKNINLSEINTIGLLDLLINNGYYKKNKVVSGRYNMMLRYPLFIFI